MVILMVRKLRLKEIYLRPNTIECAAPLSELDFPRSKSFSKIASVTISRGILTSKFLFDVRQSKQYTKMRPQETELS